MSSHKPRRPLSLLAPKSDGKVRVPLTQKQYQMMMDAEQALQAAAVQRNTVLNALAAGVEFDGDRSFEGMELIDKKWHLVLVKPQAPPEQKAKEE